MALTHGMNVDEVKALGKYLRQQQDEINRLVRQIETKVNSAGWEGNDARTFKTQWWPQHRNALECMGRELEDFGRKAIENANEQEQVSNRT